MPTLFLYLFNAHRTSMPRHFLAIDSMGKLASKGKKKAYWYQACEWTDTEVGIYAPGASLVEIMRDVVAHVRLANYDSGSITSMMNQLGMSHLVWQSGKRKEYCIEISAFAAKMHEHRIDTTFVIGGDPLLWPSCTYSEADYRFIQADIISIARQHGIRCFTGMEPSLGDGLGQFKNRVDSMGHIFGTARDDAMSWLQAILTLPLEGNIPTRSVTTPPPSPCPPPTAVTNVQAPPHPKVLLSVIRGLTINYFVQAVALHPTLGGLKITSMLMGERATIGRKGVIGCMLKLLQAATRRDVS